jgi:Spy/CpxP family protein refolding chaperone
MKNKWLILILIFSVAVNVAALFTIGVQWSRHFWRQHPLAKPPFSEQHRELLRRKLNLTEDQYQQVKEAHDAFNAEMETMHSSLRAKREALFRQLRAPDPDLAEIDTLLVEMATLQADIERKVVDNLLSMKNVLTPEQRERFLSLIDRRFSEHRRPFGPGQRERRGPFRPKKEMFPPEDTSQER